MTFAQWGYPRQNADKFREQFPADFISEAIDQTRGWFYSQLAISTMLFGEPPVESPSPAAENAASVSINASGTATMTPFLGSLDD